MRTTAEANADLAERVGLVSAGRLGIDRGAAEPIGIVAGGELLLDPALLRQTVPTEPVLPEAVRTEDVVNGKEVVTGQELVRGETVPPTTALPDVARLREPGALPRQRAGGVPAGRRILAGRSGRRTPVRLTRRGRMVVLAFLVLLAGAVAALVALPSQAAAPAPPPRVVVVQPGDSLWTIVGRYRAGADPVRAMDELRRANGLTGTTLYAGEELTLPAGW